MGASVEPDKRGIMIGRCKVSDRIWQIQSEFVILIRALGRIIHVAWEPHVYTVTSSSELFTEDGLLGEKYPLYSVEFNQKWNGSIYEITVSATKVEE